MDEAIETDAQVGQVDRAEHAIDADLQVNVLEELQPVAQPLRRRQGQVRDQPGQALQADRREQAIEARCRQVQPERETRQSELRELDVREGQCEGGERREQSVQLGQVDRRQVGVDRRQFEQLEVGEGRQIRELEAGVVQLESRPILEELLQRREAERRQVEVETRHTDVGQRGQRREDDVREIELPARPAREQLAQRRQTQLQVGQAQVQVGHAELELPVEARQRRQRQTRQCEAKGQVRERRQAREDDIREAQLERRPKRDQLAQLRQRQAGQVQIQIGHAQHRAPVEVRHSGQLQRRQRELQARDRRQLERQTREVGHREGGQRRQDAAEAGQLEGEVEIVADIEEIKYAELGLDPHTKDVLVEVQHHLLTGAAHGYVPSSALERLEVGEEARHRVALREGAVQAETDVAALQSQERVRADQASEVCRGLERKVLQARDRQARGRSGAQQREREIQVLDGETDGVRVGGVLLVDDTVFVGVRPVGALDADKGVDVHSSHDQRIGRGDDLLGGHIEADTVQAALLKSEAPLQAHQVGQLGGGMAYRGLEDQVVGLQLDRGDPGGNVAARDKPAVGEVDDVAGLAALVDRDVDVIEGESYEVAHADEADAVGMGRERGELHTRHTAQRVQRGVARLVQAEAKVQVVNDEADGVRVDGVVVIDVTVIVSVGSVGPVNTNEGLYATGTDLEAIDLDVAQQHPARTFNRKRSRLTLGKREGALDVDEVRNAQRGLGDRGADRGSLHVQQDRRATRRDLIAPSPGEALLEIQRRRPARGLVQADIESKRRELEVGRIKTVQCQGVGTGLQRCVLDAARLDLQQTEVDVLGAQTVELVGLAGKGLLCVKPTVGIADEDVDGGPADREALTHGQVVVVGVLQAGEGALLEADRAASVDKVRNAQHGRAGVGAQARTLEVKPYRRGPSGHVQAAWPGEIQFPAGRTRAVVFELHVRHRELEVLRVEAVRGHVPGTGLQRGVGRSRRVLQAQQAEGQPVDAEAVQAAGLLGQGLGAVDAAGGVTDEGRDATAADGEALGAGDLRGSAARAQRVAVVGALEAEGTAEVDKARELQRSVAGVDAEALAAAEIQGHAFCATELQPTAKGRGEVDRLARSVGPVDLQVQVLRGKLEIVTVEAVQAGIVHARAEGGVTLPARLDDGQAEVQAFHTEAVEIVRLLRKGLGRVEAAVGVAHESVDVTPGDGHHRGGRDLAAIVACELAGGRVAFEADAAAQVNEIRQLQRDIALGTQQFALSADEAQCHRAGSTGGHQHRLRREVDDDVVGLGGLIQLDRQVAHGGQQVGQADEADAGGLCAQRGPAARGVGLAGHQGQAEGHVIQHQPDRIGRACAHPSEDVDRRAAQSEQIDLDLVAGGLTGLLGERHRFGALLYRDAALDADEAEQVDQQRATGPQQFALLAREAEGERAGGACDHRQVGGARSVVDHRRRSTAGLVDRQRDAGGRDHHVAAQADESGRAGRGLQRGPGASRGRGVAIGLLAQQRQAESHI